MPKIAEVAFPVPLNRTFDYILPENVAARAGVGSRIRASFGHRRMGGFLVSVREGEVGARPLKSIDDSSPPLWGPEMVELAK